LLLPNPARVRPLNFACALYARYRCAQFLSDTIPRSITSALVVLQSPDGGAYTFLWDGTDASDAGDGDCAAALLPRSLLRRPLSFAANATGDAWRVTLYATPALMGQYVTTRPRDTALAVIAASLACVLLFGCARVQRCQLATLHVMSSAHAWRSMLTLLIR
jgi:hypothetical protein